MIKSSAENIKEILLQSIQKKRITLNLTTVAYVYLVLLVSRIYLNKLLAFIEGKY